MDVDTIYSQNCFMKPVLVVLIIKVNFLAKISLYFEMFISFYWVKPTYAIYFMIIFITISIV